MYVRLEKRALRMQGKSGARTTHLVKTSPPLLCGRRLPPLHPPHTQGQPGRGMTIESLLATLVPCAEDPAPDEDDDGCGGGGGR